MAKLLMFSVQDAAADAFIRPFCFPAVGLAHRSFADEVNRNSADNSMYQHPDDYSLWRIGEFDEDSGIITPCQPERIAAGSQVKVR